MMEEENWRGPSAVRLGSRLRSIRVSSHTWCLPEAKKKLAMRQVNVRGGQAGTGSPAAPHLKTVFVFVFVFFWSLEAGKPRELLAGCKRNPRSRRRRRRRPLRLLLCQRTKQVSTTRNKRMDGQADSSGQHTTTDDEWEILREKQTTLVDQLQTSYEVTENLRNGGLSSIRLITGIDFTKGSRHLEENSSNWQCLHQVGRDPNPYEQVMNIMGKTLSPLLENNFVHCFGFGDESTCDKDVFTFYPDERPCKGYQEAVERYIDIAPHVKLAEPKCFAPIIEMAINITQKSGCFFHILLIIADGDGQFLGNVNTQSDKLSLEEERTMNALVKASEYPLSIILVGVGGGPWDLVKRYEDYQSKRFFDNLQFVNFTEEMMSQEIPKSRKEAEFASKALAKVLLQYAYMQEFGIEGNPFASLMERVPLPPPVPSYIVEASSPSPMTSSRKVSKVGINPVTANTPPYNKICQLCGLRIKEVILGCGHEVCKKCLSRRNECPVCQDVIRLMSSLSLH